MVNKTALIYTNKYQSYNFGPQHPLRPLRIKLTYSLMEKLNLFNNKRLEIFEPISATQKEIERAHDPEYVEIVKKLSLIKKMEGARDNGLFKYIGFSFHDTLKVFKEILDYYHWDCCQIQFNYLDIEYQAGLEG